MPAIVEDKQYNGLPIYRKVQVYTKEEIDALLGTVSGTTYTSTAPTTEDVGGIPAGSNFVGETMQDIWEELLHKYQLPAFSSFVLFGISVLEVGDIISGVKNFTWGTTNPSNVLANSIAIRDVTGAVNLLIGLANDGSENYNFVIPIQKIVASTNVFRITGTNTHANLFTMDLTIYWRWRVFYGTSPNTSLIEAQIEALANSGLQSAFAGNYTFAGGNYKYVCYPAALGTATIFTDTATGLNVPFEPVVVVAVTNPFGITTNYNVHRSTNILGSAITIGVS